MLEVSGCIITVDAMGTQKNIAEKMISKNADYILSLKDNQKTLFRDAKLYLDDIRNDKSVTESSNYHKTVEKAHGRIETRTCVISEEIGWLTGKEEWNGINGIGAIYCEIEQNGHKSKQNHYFMYSCKGVTAAEIMKHKRNLGVLKTNFIGFWIWHFVKMKAGQERTIRQKTLMLYAKLP